MLFFVYVLGVLFECSPNIIIFDIIIWNMLYYISHIPKKEKMIISIYCNAPLLIKIKIDLELFVCATEKVF